MGNPHTEAWLDRTGRPLVIGATVIEPVRGKVVSRWTKPEKDTGKRVPRVSIATDKPFTKNRRTVKSPGFPTSECLLRKN